MRFSQCFMVLCMICCIGGCRLRSIEVTSKEDFMRLLDGNIQDIHDVLKLFPLDADIDQAVADVSNRLALTLEMAKEEIAAIIAIKPEERTFANTVQAYDKVANKYAIAGKTLRNMELVHPSKALRDACHEAYIELSSQRLDIFLSVDIYNAFKAYVENHKESLSKEEAYFLQDVMQGFKLNGLHLSVDKLAKVKSLQKEISKLSSEFIRNIALDKRTVLVADEELTGIDEDFIQSLKQDEQGKRIITMAYPTVYMVLQHCSNGDVRKKVLHAFQNRAYPVNKPILEKVIKLREILANLIGFDDFNQYAVADKMAKTPETVFNFLHGLEKRVVEKERAEFEMLAKDLPEGIELKDGKFKDYDFLYVKEAYKKKLGLDEREISEYFVMEKTIQGIFDIYQKFLGLEFKLTSPEGLWHKDASVIEIKKKGDAKVIGYLFLDLYPREDKYTHACCSLAMAPVGDSPAVIMIVANFPKSTKTKPSLLKHSDVTTFFHEFGHAMHACLGRTQMAAHAGYRTVWDFVEVPSQMFEEWMWDKEMLQNITAHYQTGESLPDALIEKKIAMKKLFSGGWIQRQAYLSLLSLEYYKNNDGRDVDQIVRDVYSKIIKHVAFNPELHMYCSFGHLMEYNSVYYSYLWSLVIALDMFYDIKKQGLLNEAVGQKLIQAMLGVGGSRDPNEAVREFLGRDFNQEAFLQDFGIS